MNAIGRPSRRQYIRRRIAVITAFVVVIAVGIYLPLTLLAPLAPAFTQMVPFSNPDRTAASPVLPAFGASAIGAIGYPQILAAAGSTAPLPIASISKIVTSLVVLEAKPLSLDQPGPTITFSAADAALMAKYVALNGETKPLSAGSTISQLDLMRVTLVASANNYADALAGWAFGTRAAFEQAVTAWLSGHKLTHTTLLEPTGINPGNVSTATELVEIGKLALANPVIASIVSTRSMSLASIGTITNTNTMLGKDGVDGIKTGTLSNISNLLFSATLHYGSHSVTVVGTVLGGSGHRMVDDAVTTLLESVRSGFHEITLATRGEAFATLTTAWAQKVTAISTRSQSLLAWSNTPVTATIDSPPVRIGMDHARVGFVTFTVGLQKVRVPLTLDRSLYDPGPLWRLSNPAALIG